MAERESKILTRRAVLKGIGGAAGVAVALSLPRIPDGIVRLSEGPMSDREPLARHRVAEASADPSLDFDIPGGHFYTQTKGETPHPHGYRVIDDEKAKLWKVFNSYGAVGVWGYPVSDRWTDEVGRVTQAMQKGIFQLTVENGRVKKVEWMNIFDELEKRGINLDSPTDITPNSFDWSSDREKPWGHDLQGAYPGTIEDNHMRTVFSQAGTYTQLSEAYFSNPYWFDQYGLPMSIKDYGNVITMRCQRAELQLWKDKTPWTRRPLEVVVANGGDVAKKFGLIPEDAATPKPLVPVVEQPAPTSTPKPTAIPQPVPRPTPTETPKSSGQICGQLETCFYNVFTFKYQKSPTTCPPSGFGWIPVSSCPGPIRIQ